MGLYGVTGMKVFVTEEEGKGEVLDYVTKGLTK